MDKDQEMQAEQEHFVECKQMIVENVAYYEEGYERRHGGISIYP